MTQSWPSSWKMLLESQGLCCSRRWRTAWGTTRVLCCPWAHRARREPGREGQGRWMATLVGRGGQRPLREEGSLRKTETWVPGGLSAKGPGWSLVDGAARHRGPAWRLMLGTTGHHGGRATGRTVNQSKGIGVPRAVSELHGTGWAGPGDGDIILPGKLGS